MVQPTNQDGDDGGIAVVFCCPMKKNPSPKKHPREISIKNNGIGYRCGILATPSHLDFVMQFFLDGVDCHYGEYTNCPMDHMDHFRML